METVEPGFSIVVFHCKKREPILKFCTCTSLKNNTPGITQPCGFYCQPTNLFIAFTSLQCNNHVSICPSWITHLLGAENRSKCGD
jgi:hypothetical protein